MSCSRWTLRCFALSRSIFSAMGSLSRCVSPGGGGKLGTGGPCDSSGLEDAAVIANRRRRAAQVLRAARLNERVMIGTIIERRDIRLLWQEGDLHGSAA